MQETLKWIDTAGGPHIFIPEEYVDDWMGSDYWWDNIDPNDQSDYARACRVEGWVGKVKCGQGEATIFGGDVGPIAWIPTFRLIGGLMVQWIAADSEEDVIKLVCENNFDQLIDEKQIECSELATGRSGIMRLFDSVENGKNIPMQEDDLIRLSPGKYLLRAGYVETDSMMLVLRELRRSK